MQNELFDEYLDEIISYRGRYGYRIMQILKNLCVIKNKLLMQHIIDCLYESSRLNNCEFFVHELLELADKQQDTDMVDFLIKKNSTKINCLPQEIVRTKYLSSINFFLSCNTNINFINNILNYAISNADTKIIQLCIEKGAIVPTIKYTKIFRWNKIDIEFIKLLINNNGINLNNQFINVCQNSIVNIEILKLFVDSGVTNINDGFIDICENNKVTEQLIKFFIDNGATNLNDAFIKICENNSGNNNSIKLFIDNGVTNLNDGFLVICQKCCVSIEQVQIFVNSGVTNLNDGFMNIFLNKVISTTKIINIIDFFMHKNVINKDIIKKITNKNLPLCLRLEYGIAIKLIDFCNLIITDLLLVLCNNNIIIFESKKFSLKNIIEVILMDFSLILITSELHNKQFLTITEIIRIYSEVPEKLITNTYKIELMQSYLDGQLWKPIRYNIFPLNIKERIFAFVLVVKRFSVDKLGCKIPKPLVHMIINFLVN